MAKTFKTLAEFKRVLAVGDRVNCIRHTYTGRDENGKLIRSEVDTGIREVSIKQSNSFALKTTQTTGKVVDSWCEFPKASMAKVEDNVLTILFEDRVSGETIPSLTYKFVD